MVPYSWYGQQESNNTPASDHVDNSTVSKYKNSADICSPGSISVFSTPLVTTYLGTYLFMNAMHAASKQRLVSTGPSVDAASPLPALFQDSHK